MFKRGKHIECYKETSRKISLGCSDTLKLRKICKTVLFRFALQVNNMLHSPVEYVTGRAGIESKSNWTVVKEAATTNIDLK